jgi:hypothetical protein
MFDVRTEKALLRLNIGNNRDIVVTKDRSEFEVPYLLSLGILELK